MSYLPVCNKYYKLTHNLSLDQSAQEAFDSVLFLKSACFVSRIAFFFIIIMVIYYMLNSIKYPSLHAWL